MSEKKFTSLYNRFWWLSYIFGIAVIVGGIILSLNFFLSLIIAVVIFFVTGSVISKISDKEIKKIKERITRKIEQGDLNAQIELGVFLMSAASNIEGLNEAKNWIEKAVALGHKDAQTRLNECIEKMCAAAKKVAKSAFYKTSYVYALKVAKEITDQSVLEIFATKALHEDVRKAAIEKITDQSFLKELALNDSNYSVRKAAVLNITDHSFLKEVALNDSDYHIRIAVV